MRSARAVPVLRRAPMSPLALALEGQYWSRPSSPGSRQGVRWSLSVCDFQKLWRSGDYGAGIIARSAALGTAIATLILGSSLAGAVVLALRSTAAVRSSGEAHWRALAMLAALLSVVLLSGVVAARP